MTEAFASFLHSNPDCNFDAIEKELISLLTQIAEADGRLDEREHLAIDKIEQLLDQHASALTPVGQITSSPTKAWGWVSQKFFGKKSG
jgi:uncharacterized tellurite resistance protein B-like protein